MGKVALALPGGDRLELAEGRRVALQAHRAPELAAARGTESLWTRGFIAMDNEPLVQLIDALRAGKLVPGFPASREPLELARATLYLPTRRACSLAREVFLDRLDGDAAILPRIVALGDLDEDADEIGAAEARRAQGPREIFALEQLHHQEKQAAR